MNVPKRSMDEISLELTERCIELESRKCIPSDVGLEYSHTQLSIQDPQEPCSPLVIHHEHLPKIDSRIHRYAELGEGLYGIESPETADRGRVVLHMCPRGERQRECENFSLQTRPGKQRPNDQRSRCGSLGTKPALPPKLPAEKENQQTYQMLKVRLEEEKRKYQNFRVTFRGWEYRRSSHLAEGEKHSGFGDILAKRIRLDYNEAQEKKYLQRIIMNRQSILHVSQRLSRLPLLQ